MKLAEIVGYQLDLARCAALRSVNRALAGTGLKPADLTALLLAREQPGCDQTTLGRALAGNRALGMKIASRLEAHGLLTRGIGRDRRSKGLHLSAAGERLLDHGLERHRRAEAVLGARLTAAERAQLLALLVKVHDAVGAEEAGLDRDAEAA